MNSSVSIITLATIFLSFHNIVAQDKANSEALGRLKAGSAHDIELAISSLPKATLDQPEIARQLTLLLNDQRAVVDHPMVRETVSDRAWFKLLELPSGASTSILKAVPSLETDYARGQALEAIARIGKPNPLAYDMILPYCRESDVSLRSRAISALSAVADDSDKSISQFGKLLLDSDPTVKWTVLDALEERHERIASLMPDLVKLLDDDSDVHIAVSNHFAIPEKLRGRVARLFVKMGPVASDALAKLKVLTGPEYDRNVRVWSAAAVCRIAGSPKEALNLMGHLMLDDMNNEHIQDDAPSAIAQLGTSARPLLDSLERAKKHKSAQIRWGLVDAFFAVDPDSAVSRCLSLMEDDDELVATTVIEAFSKRSISESRVVAAYIGVLGNHEGIFDEPASSAVVAIAKLGPSATEAMPALQKLAQEPMISDSLKEAVADALRRIR